jgi:hypothetical protein
MRDIPLHDIKPLVEVPDDSLSMLMILLAIIVGLILLGLMYWLYRFFQEKKAVDLRKMYLEKLHAVDTTQSKEAAYTISQYGHLLAKSEREMELLRTLDERLSEYKYKKEVNAIDKETLGYFQLFLEVVDAS